MHKRLKGETIKQQKGPNKLMDQTPNCKRWFQFHDFCVFLRELRKFNHRLEPIVLIWGQNWDDSQYEDKYPSDCNQEFILEIMEQPCFAPGGVHFVRICQPHGSQKVEEDDAGVCKVINWSVDLFGVCVLCSEVIEEIGNWVYEELECHEGY